MEFGKSDWRTFEQGIRKEWLLTNGIGGFASSTIIGANTRRYHGLLVASLVPPVKRHLVLSKIDESVTMGDATYNIYSFKTPGYIMEGFHHLQKVSIDPLPTFVYRIEDMFLSKKVCMVYGQNTVVVVYRITNGSKAIRLRLAPLVNFRDYHHTSKRNHMDFDLQHNDCCARIKPYHSSITISLSCSQGRFIRRDDDWFYSMEYPMEAERGLDSVEDHYIPGFFEIFAQPWEEKYITFCATIEDGVRIVDGLPTIACEEKRIMAQIENAGYREDDFASSLVAAADNFIVYRRSTDSKTIIAGYPWFTDWGRDAMVSFTGLTLCTKRFEDARQILLTFARHQKYGLIPNVFPDDGIEPAYNSVDASLWYFEAITKYIKYTGDLEFVRKHLYNTLEEIIHSYIKGTIFGIKMDEDCLITAGDSDTQLTWMDAKAGGRPVTPRHGKAVEVNALWYNALKVMAEIAFKFNGHWEYYRDIAEKVSQSFEKTFWNNEGGCLYDVVNGSFRDARIRPNQVLAISLSHSVLNGDKAKLVIEKVWQKLYTDYGLRSLSADSAGYVGIYSGGQYERDSGYHQGTVWAWLFGHFITAFLKVCGYTEKNRQTALKLMEPFRDHLKEACVGNISEIFDGNQPHMPRGCFAQAWSVGEILRAYIEDICNNLCQGNGRIFYI